MVPREYIMGALIPVQENMEGAVMGKGGRGVELNYVIL